VILALGSLLFLGFFPLFIIPLFISWRISSKMLKAGPKIEFT
jgi:uncharacterized protein YneF (UPF0154 family)